MTVRYGQNRERQCDRYMLHPSQREIYTSDEYADFELHLRPTYDFCMELLKVGAMIEVLEPQSLRHQLHGCIKDMWKIYEND